MRRESGINRSSDAIRSERVKAHNKSLVFNLIRSERAVSRAALTKLTGMSPTSTGRIVGELIEDGFIREIGMTEGGLGRRAALVELDPDGLLAIGVSLDIPVAHIGIVNLAGEAVNTVSCSIDPDADAAQISEQLIQEIAVLWAALTDQQRARVTGIGVAVPGQVLWPTGLVSQSPQLGWRQYPMQDEWNARLHLPVYVENDVKAAALAEGLFGAASDVEDYVVVKIGSGLGAAVVTGGELLRGQGNLAGEIGHMIVDKGGERCDCGRYGCLQTYVCQSALERQGRASMADLLRQAGEQREPAAQLLQRASDLLTRWTANLANLYNTRKVLFYGELFESWPDLIQEVKGRLGQYLWAAEHAAFTVELVEGSHREATDTRTMYRNLEESVLVRAAASQVFQDKLAQQLPARSAIGQGERLDVLVHEQENSIYKKGR